MRRRISLRGIKKTKARRKRKTRRTTRRRSDHIVSNANPKLLPHSINLPYTPSTLPHYQNYTEGSFRLDFSGFFVDALVFENA